MSTNVNHGISRHGGLNWCSNGFCNSSYLKRIFPRYLPYPALQRSTPQMHVCLSCLSGLQSQIPHTYILSLFTPYHVKTASPVFLSYPAWSLGPICKLMWGMIWWRRFSRRAEVCSIDVHGLIMVESRITCPWDFWPSRDPGSRQHRRLHWSPKWSCRIYLYRCPNKKPQQIYWFSYWYPSFLERRCSISVGATVMTSKLDDNLFQILP